MKFGGAPACDEGHLDVGRGLATVSAAACCGSRNFCVTLIKRPEINFVRLTLRVLDFYMNMQVRGLPRNA
ncbi:hypothetical protein [Bradyrhizobium hipponense]|uniref:hypothetical protein n=1 Tax=Bradyrhizobium hipponense TaxID=2605638 RepID=UPI001AEE773B|nr:hypothetical protein [Bradyrhizobium hipponense]